MAISNRVKELTQLADPLDASATFRKRHEEFSAEDLMVLHKFFKSHNLQSTVTQIEQRLHGMLQRLIDQQARDFQKIHHFKSLADEYGFDALSTKAMKALQSTVKEMEPAHV